MEYVIETTDAVEYTVDAAEVAEVGFEHGVAAFDFVDGTSQAFAAGYWTRCYLRTTGAEGEPS